MKMSKLITIALCCVCFLPRISFAGGISNDELQAFCSKLGYLGSQDLLDKASNEDMFDAGMCLSYISGLRQGYAHGLAGGASSLSSPCIPAEISNYELAAAFQTYRKRNEGKPQNSDAMLMSWLQRWTDQNCVYSPN